MNKTERQVSEEAIQGNIAKNLETMVIKIGKCEKEEEDEDDVHRDNDSTTTQEIRECKICLQSSKDAPQPFIQPCLCTGSVRFVHEDCFQQWMKRLIIQKNSAENTLPKQVSCQICKMKYQIEANLDKVCISWQRFKLKMRIKTCQFVLLLGLIVGSIMILSIAGAIVPKSIFNVGSGSSNTDSLQQQNGGPMQQVWKKVIVILCLCILVIVLFFSLYIFIQKFCFTYKVQFKYKGRQQKTMKVTFQVLQ